MRKSIEKWIALKILKLYGLSFTNFTWSTLEYFASYFTVGKGVLTTAHQRYLKISKLRIFFIKKINLPLPSVDFH